MVYEEDASGIRSAAEEERFGSFAERYVIGRAPAALDDCLADARKAFDEIKRQAKAWYGSKELR